MIKIISISAVGYFTALCGLILGILFVMYIFKNKMDAFYTFIRGFSASLLVSFVCFCMLPTAFDTNGLYISIGGILLGVLLSYLAERKWEKIKRADSKYTKSALVLAFIMSIYNLAEGIALGVLLNYSTTKNYLMVIIFVVHCLLQALTIFIPMKENNTRMKTMVQYAFLLAIPMYLGALWGVTITSIFANIGFFALSISCGVILYVTCGEIAPQHNQIYKRYFAALGVIMGLALGVLA